MSYEIGLSTPGVANQGFTLWICSVVMIIVAGLFVSARFAIRFHHGRLGLDDWIVLASLMSSVLLSITECFAVHYGYGKHSRDLTHHDQVVALKWFFAAQVMYKVVITINKVSFLCLYLRIFIQPVFRWICYGGIAFLNVWGLAYILATIFQCQPIASAWDKTIEHPTCVDRKAQWFSYEAINIVSDVAILALPMFPIRQLRLPRAKKWGLAVIFSLGMFVCVTSIIRMTTLVESADNKDPTSGPIPATVWSVVEANTGIICACLPVFKHPLQFFFPKLFGSQQKSIYLTDRYRMTFLRPYTKTTDKPIAETEDEQWRDIHSSSSSGERGYWSNKWTQGIAMFQLGNRSRKSLAKNRNKNEIIQMTDVRITYDKM